jgi:hypothetical protein
LRPNWWNPGRCAWCIRWFRRAWPPCCIRSGRDPGLIRARRHHRLCRATWRRQWSLTIAKGTVPLDRLPAGICKLLAFSVTGPRACRQDPMVRIHLPPAASQANFRIARVGRRVNFLIAV